MDRGKVPRRVQRGAAPSGVIRVGEASRKKRSAVMDSLNAWLAGGEGLRTWQMCTPNVVVSRPHEYLTMEYLQHQGSTKASGERCCVLVGRQACLLSQGHAL